MKVKDLPANLSLKQTKVRIPEAHHRSAVAAGLTTMEVYLRSNWRSGIWVKENLNSQRMFPL